MGTIRKDNLLTPFSRPADYFGGMLGQFLRNWEDESSVDTTLWNPAVDIKEEQDKYVVCADLPGVEKKDIHVSLTNNALTIRGERRYEKSENKEGYSRMERLQGQFYRRFMLPETTDESHIKAKYKKGVLEIIIPKKPSAQSKEIEIRIEE